MDFYGLVIGITSFFIILFFSFYLLSKYKLDRPHILKLVILCALGHFIGGILYYLYTLYVGADSGWYFDQATTRYEGSGYFFAFFVLGYLKLYLLGDSLLGAFLLFASLGFLGSIFYLLTYKIILDRLSGGYKYYLVDQSILYFPALLLLCWPSYFFWSAGLVKDSFAFLSIGMFLFFIVDKKNSILNICMLVLAISMGLFVRPYLFIIVSASGVIYVLIGSKWNMAAKIGIILCIAYAFSIVVPLVPQLQDYGNMLHIGSSGSNAPNISSYILFQQKEIGRQGTTIPMPTNDPHLIFFFLPYMILANLFLPLFIGAKNLIGMVASVENIYLLWLVYFFFKNRKIWKCVSNNVQLTKFFIVFFLVGMSCLSIMCTNLGLAMREKMMYVPALLVAIMLTYAYKRILIVQYFIKNAENNNQSLYGNCYRAS